MTIQLLLKIGAVGILVALLIKAFGEGRAGIPAESGRTYPCTFVDHSLYRRIL